MCSIRFTRSIDSAGDVSIRFIFGHLHHMAFLVLDIADGVDFWFSVIELVKDVFYISYH